MAATIFERYVGKDAKVNDASTIRFFRDHLTFLDEVISEEKKKIGLLDLATQHEDQATRIRQCSREFKLHGELTDRKGSEGICHSVMLESYALPKVNVGSDSHTPHVGAIGCVAAGSTLY